MIPGGFERQVYCCFMHVPSSVLDLPPLPKEPHFFHLYQVIYNFPLLLPTFCTYLPTS